MRFAFVCLFLMCGAALAQNRTCPTGTSSFSVQYGDKFNCNLTSGTHRHQLQAAANDVFGFHINRATGAGDLCVAVENQSGTVLIPRICTNTVSVPGNRDAIRAPAAGTYTIVVSEAGNTFQPFEYSLMVERMFPPTASSPLLGPNETVRGSINPRGDRDLYQFMVAKDDTYSFQLRRTAGAGDFRMYVIDQFGEAQQVVSGGRAVTATSAGTFGLWILDNGGNDVGEYEVTFTCRGTCPRPPPEVSGIVNAAHSRAGLCRGAFAAVFGKYFSTVTRLWDRRDFTGNALPTTVEGARASFGVLSGYSYFVSDNQMNIILPAVPAGKSELKVRTPNGESAGLSTDIVEFCPALFMFPDQRYVVGVYPDRTVARTPSVAGRALRPGDVISLFGTGFGPTVPAYPEGELLPVPLETTQRVTVQIGGAPADVLYSGLIAPGLYQLNVRVPVVAVGEQPIRVQVGGVASPEGVSILVAQP